MDPFVKIFDMRNRKNLPPYPFEGGLLLCQFHPLEPNKLAIVSQSGVFQMWDMMVDPAEQPLYQLECSGVSSFDICSTGEAVAFGDASSSFFIWGTKPLEELPF